MAPRCLVAVPGGIRRVTQAQRAVWLGFGLLLLASLYPLWRRHAAESRNLAVSLAVEYDAVETLAAGEGIPLDAAMQQLKGAGVDTIVLNEETIADLIGQGDVDLLATSVRASSADLSDPSPKAIRLTSIELRNESVLPRLQRGLVNRFGDRVGRIEPRSGKISLPELPLAMVRSTSINLSPEQVSLARQFNFQIVARLGNPAAASETSLRETIRWTAEYGVLAYLPLGDQVLGRKDLLPVVVDELRRKQIAYASPEFAKIGGDATMLTMADDLVIRLHTAQLAELEKLGEADIVDRYARAAKERQMRILLVRPSAGSTASPVGAFAGTLRKIADEVKSDGLVIARPHAFTDPKLGSLVPIGLGLVAAVALTLFAFGFAAEIAGGSLPARWMAALGVGLILLAGAGLGRTVLTLLVSVITPALAIFVAMEWLPALDRLPGLMQALARSVLASALSLVGGLYVAATMTGLPYMIRAEEFTGVKVAVFLPIVLVGCLYALRGRDVRSVMAAPLTYGAIVTGIVLAGVLGLLLSRTGNDGVGVSGIELVMRNALDRYLFVRPRTKEFLIGHPAMLIAFAFAATLGSGTNRSGTNRAGPDRRTLVLALGLAMGAIGQTGIVNTLCHGHIPIQLSVVRIGLGLAFGLLFGGLAWLAIAAILPKWRRFSENGSGEFATPVNGAAMGEERRIG
ncbi:MAG: DUF5693 family protein [Fimbriimonadaceae bacterium]|nr:DUF5693 family protein [Fimbriimonadaceae bacterium]